MELEEIKTAWLKMDKELQQQKSLTDNLIIDMTKQRYENRFSGITISESIAAAICWGIALYIIVNLGSLDTWYFLASGIFTIMLLITLPIFSLKLLYKVKSINIKENTYKESILQFTTPREKLLLFQRITLYLNIVLVLVILPLAAKLLSNKDVFGEFSLWGWYLPVMFIFLAFFSRWVYNAYKGVTIQAGKILEEIERN